MSIKTAVTPQTARHDEVSREVSEGMSEVEIVWDYSGALEITKARDQALDS